MQVSVIIVNYNTTQHLIKCLDSIIQFTKDVEFEIIVIDNNSPYLGVHELISYYPNVIFDFLNENIGFSKANNFAANKSNSKYLLFLNPDTRLIQDCVSPI